MIIKLLMLCLLSSAVGAVDRFPIERPPIGRPVRRVIEKKSNKLRDYLPYVALGFTIGFITVNVMNGDASVMAKKSWSF